MSQIFRLKDIFYGVRKHLSALIGMTVGGMVVGVMLFVLQSFSSSSAVSYQIFASFSVSTSNYAGVFTNGMDTPNLGDFELANELFPAVSYICRSQKVCDEALERAALLGVKTETLQKALALSQHGETSVVEITLRWADRDEGLQLLRTVLDVLPGAMQEVLKVGGIQMIEPPVAAEIAADVSPAVILTLTGVGFLIGMLYCLSQLYLHPTLIEVRDVNELFDIDLLSDIPEEPDFPTYLNQNLITNRNDLPAGFRESYTALAHILLHQMDEDHFCLFVTSAARGEGKTTVVANLGLELAALDKRVLLIDFDLSSPSLGGCFLDDIDYMHSINAVYFDETSTKEAIIKINENLDILPAKLDKRHMGVNRFAKKLVTQMQEEYDIVLLDTEPVGESSEMLYFSTVSNSALFVIRYDFTPCDQIESSVEKLKKTNTTIHGAVVNRVARLGVGRASRETGHAENRSAVRPAKVKKRSTARRSAVSLESSEATQPLEAPADGALHAQDDPINAPQDDEAANGQAFAAPSAQPPHDILAEDDDSDLKDDEALEQFLMRFESPREKRRSLSMLQDDEHGDEAAPAQADRSPKASAAKKKAAKKQASQPQREQGDAPADEDWDDGEADGGASASEWDGDDF